MFQKYKILRDQGDEIVGVLAIIGVVAPPIGIIHGFVLWFS